MIKKYHPSVLYVISKSYIRGPYFKIKNNPVIPIYWESGPQGGLYVNFSTLCVVPGKRKVVEKLLFVGRFNSILSGYLVFVGSYRDDDNGGVVSLVLVVLNYI